MAFKDLLKQNVSEIEEPKSVPSGTWKSELLGVSLKAPKSEDANYKVRALMTLKPIEPREDVDTDRASEFMQSEDYEDARLFMTVFLAGKRDVIKVKRILTAAGYTGSIEGAVEEIDGGYVLDASVSEAPDDDDPDIIRNNVSGVSKSE
jgi:hypothetical protein